MRGKFVIVATLLSLTAGAAVGGCGEDPILKAAHDAAAKKAAGSDVPGGGQEAGTPEEPKPGTPEGAAPGAAGQPAAGGTTPGLAGAPAPGIPEEPEPAPPGSPPPAGSQKAGVPEEPKPAPPGSPGGAPHGVEGAAGAPLTPGKAEPPAPGAPGSPPPILGPTVTISGFVVYSSWRKGGVRVDAFDGDHTRHGTQPGVVATARLDKPGAFSLTVPQNAGKVYVEAVVDEDGDGKPGPQDPMGTAERYPVTVETDPVDGLVVELIKHEPPPGGKKKKDDF